MKGEYPSSLDCAFPNIKRYCKEYDISDRDTARGKKSLKKDNDNNNNMADGFSSYGSSGQGYFACRAWEKKD
jgi:hypothetical protein